MCWTLAAGCPQPDVSVPNPTCLSLTQHVCSQRVQGGGAPDPPLATQVGDGDVRGLLRRGAQVPFPALGCYFGELLLRTPGKT